MMILTEYLIDVLSRLSCLVAAIAMLTCVVAIYSTRGVRVLKGMADNE